MTAFYDRMRKLADRQLAAKGKPVTITRTANDGSVTTRTALALVAGYVKHALADSNIAIGDQRLLLDATADPKPGDRITDADGSRVIVDPVIPQNPAGTLLYFECYARLG